MTEFRIQAPLFFVNQDHSILQFITDINTILHASVDPHYVQCVEKHILGVVGCRMVDIRGAHNGKVHRHISCLHRDVDMPAP